MPDVFHTNVRLALLVITLHLFGYSQIQEYRFTRESPVFQVKSYSVIDPIKQLQDFAVLYNVNPEYHSDEVSKEAVKEATEWAMKGVLQALEDKNDTTFTRQMTETGKGEFQLHFKLASFVRVSSPAKIDKDVFLKYFVNRAQISWSNLVVGTFDPSVLDQRLPKFM